MVQYCAVPGCGGKAGTPGTSFHSFPKDEDLRKQWIEKIRRSEDRRRSAKLSKHMKVCSQHFKDSDFKVRVNGVLKLLNDSAVPSIFRTSSPRNSNTPRQEIIRVQSNLTKKQKSSDWQLNTSNPAYHEYFLQHDVEGDPERFVTLDQYLGTQSDGETQSNVRKLYKSTIKMETDTIQSGDEADADPVEAIYVKGEPAEENTTDWRIKTEKPDVSDYDSEIESVSEASVADDPFSVQPHKQSEPTRAVQGERRSLPSTSDCTPLLINIPSKNSLERQIVMAEKKRSKNSRASSAFRDTESDKRVNSVAGSVAGKQSVKKRLPLTGRAFGCDFCFATFPTKKSLKQHVAGFCAKNLFPPNTAVERLAANSEQAPVSADAFRSSTAELNQDLLNNPKIFRCSFCDKLFINMVSRNRHLLSHIAEGKKEFKYYPKLFDLMTRTPEDKGEEVFQLFTQLHARNKHLLTHGRDQSGGQQSLLPGSPYVKIPKKRKLSEHERKANKERCRIRRLKMTEEERSAERDKMAQAQRIRRAQMTDEDRRAARELNARRERIRTTKLRNQQKYLQVAAREDVAARENVTIADGRENGRLLEANGTKSLASTATPTAAIEQEESMDGSAVNLAYPMETVYVKAEPAEEITLAETSLADDDPLSVPASERFEPTRADCGERHSLPWTADSSDYTPHATNVPDKNCVVKPIVISNSKRFKQPCAPSRVKLAESDERVNPVAVSKAKKQSVAESPPTTAEPLASGLCQPKLATTKSLTEHLAGSRFQNLFPSSAAVEIRVANGERVSLPVETFSCSCKMQFNDISQLEQHLVHRSKMGCFIISCKFCNKVFNNIGSRDQHLLTHAGDQKYECKFCPKLFTDASNRNKHLLTHTGEKKYECTFCQMLFSHSSSRNRHLLTHTGEKRFECAFCQKVFADNSTKIRHLRIHTGEKKYVCKFCPKRFRLSSNRNMHLLTHTGEKKYECKFCPKRFSSGSNRNVHLLTHTGEKKYECHFCPKLFSQKSSRNRHLQTHSQSGEIVTM